MSTPATSTAAATDPVDVPHYTATLDPGTGKYFFLTPSGKSSGWKYQKPCQTVADSCRRDAEAQDS